jgi:prevent-host-death family protein
MQNWSLHDAKNRFSAVVEAARRGQPQLVTKRGAPAVVVVAAEEFERLQALRAQRMPSFAEHLLAMPQDDEPFERIDVALRDPAL